MQKTAERTFDSKFFFKHDGCRLVQLPVRLKGNSKLHLLRVALLVQLNLSPMLLQGAPGAQLRRELQNQKTGLAASVQKLSLIVGSLMACAALGKSPSDEKMRVCTLKLALGSP